MFLSKNTVKIWTVLMVFAGMFYISNLMTLLKLPSCDLSNNIFDNVEILSRMESRNPHPSTLPRDVKKLYNFTAAICVCIRDAEAYFTEWVDYHLAMEFSNIYIYDDSETFELERWYRNTRDHPVYSKVEIIHYNRTLDEENGEDDEKIIQNYIYRDCVDRFGLRGPKHDYFAFIDVDEFLVLQTTKYSGILGVLQDYLVPFGGALTVNWMLIGDANKTVYSPIPVTKRFQYRDKNTHVVIKSIAKAKDYKRHRNPHSVKVRSEDGRNNIHTTKYPGALHEGAEGATGASDVDRPSDVLLLYHYRYTSMKEYIFKRCVRGNVDRGDIWCNKDKNGIRTGKRVPTHIGSIPGTVFDDTAWQFLKMHVPKYKLYDEFEDFS